MATLVRFLAVNAFERPVARSSMAQATSMKESPSWIARKSASAIEAKP